MIEIIGNRGMFVKLLNTAARGQRSQSQKNIWELL